MPRAPIRILIVGLVLALSWIQAPFATSAQRRVAILDFRNVTQDKEFSCLSVAVPKSLTTKLNAVRSISLIERTQIDKIFKEQEFAVPDFADPKKALKLGRLARGPGRPHR
ncbi:MAG: hypothetical protein VCE91_09230 [Nitrospinota bacterium]